MRTQFHLFWFFVVEHAAGLILNVSTHFFCLDRWRKVSECHLPHKDTRWSCVALTWALSRAPISITLIMHDPMRAYDKACAVFYGHKNKMSTTKSEPQTEKVNWEVKRKGRMAIDVPVVSSTFLCEAQSIRVCRKIDIPWNWLIFSIYVFLPLRRQP